MAAILWANIDKVYYGCNIFDTQDLGFRDALFYKMQEQAEREKFVIELDRKECLKLYKEFLSMKHTLY